VYKLLIYLNTHMNKKPDRLW